jgi:signal peptidase II
MSEPSSRSGARLMRFFAIIGLPLYLLDQATKWWIVRTMELDGPLHEVIPNFFYLCHWANTGAAFGSFKDSNTFFIILSVVTLIGLLFFAARGAFSDALSRLGVALLIPGILGNLTDRLIHGHVVDFLLFDLHVRFANPWPAFNVADSCICIAAGVVHPQLLPRGPNGDAKEERLSLTGSGCWRLLLRRPEAARIVGHHRDWRRCDRLRRSGVRRL